MYINTQFNVHHYRDLASRDRKATVRTTMFIKTSHGTPLFPGAHTHAAASKRCHRLKDVITLPAFDSHHTNAKKGILLLVLLVLVLLVNHAIFEVCIRPIFASSSVFPVGLKKASS